MMKKISEFDFTLIVGTLGRNIEFKRLLDSLRFQGTTNFEVLLIDQSAGKLDLSLLGNTPFAIQRIIAPPGLSRSRNLGLSSARGKIVAFPDDDCFYPADLLKMLKKEFESHPEYDGVSTKVTDPDGRFSAAGYMGAKMQQMTPGNIWRTAKSPSLFFRKDAVREVWFDERLGVGSNTAFLSGEETDFCLQLIEKHKNLFYLPQYVVYHPIFNGPFLPQRAIGYGMGFGGVLRKHHYGILSALRFSLYQFVRFGQYLLMGNLSRAYFHLCMGKARLSGYFCWKKD